MYYKLFVQVLNVFVGMNLQAAPSTEITLFLCIIQSKKNIPVLTVRIAS